MKVLESDLSKNPLAKEFSIRPYIPVIVAFAIISLTQLFLSDDIAALYGNLLTDITAAICLVFSVYLVFILKESQFKEIGLALMLNCALFLTAEVIYSYQDLVLGLDVWISEADLFWIGGYVPLIFICAKTVWIHHEHMDPRNMMLTFMVWVIFLLAVIIPVAFMTFAMTDTFLEGFVLSLYPVLDMVLIFFLTGILIIYKKGLVRYYWLFIAASISLYSAGDILYALFASEEIYSVGSWPDVFFSLDYCILALGLLIMIRHKEEFRKLEPKGKYSIQHVYLAYRNGLLVGSAISEKAKRGVDPEVFIGMLTAIQDFVKDSYEESDGSRLDELKYGGERFIFRRAEHYTLVALVKGEMTTAVLTNMDRILQQVGERYGDVLVDWDGNLSVVEGIKDILDDLLTES